MDFPELHTKRMKILHRDPKLHAQRVAAIKVWDARTFLMLAKAKGTAEARKRASDSVKAFFHDPENRRKRSLAMKEFLKDGSLVRKFKCGLCGERGHNRKTCYKLRSSEIKTRSIKALRNFRTCGRSGHNSRRGNSETSC
ncbi:hypothetical protein C5167_028955 [Papaver somniferum]|nr:hypothetical protein C5167_028955 [Papaver somniferum]